MCRRKTKSLARWCLILGVFVILTKFLRTNKQQTGDVEVLNLVELQDIEMVMEQRRKRYDYYMENEATRTGPGEQGRSLILKGDKKKEGDEAFSKDGFNYVASDMIALDRSLPDNRPQECKAIKYPADLPTASVIIVYYNEYWSAILRTVHSVVNRSPPSFLHEVILLDDASNKTELLEPLDRYIAETWPDGVVKLVRRKVRGGLINARLTGAQAATGDVLIFLDAHCEATQGWLEPLLSRIKEDRKVVLIPHICEISPDNLSLFCGSSFYNGGFTWALFFTWEAVPLHKKAKFTKSENIKTPTQPGGLVAIDRSWFYEVGSYDDKMEVWGGENLEMSFRVWMCGGSMEIVPCCKVGHVYRATHPYGFPVKNRDYHGLNSKRMAEVWMDDYKKLFYMYRPDLEKADVGDLTERRQIRERLNCHNFSWFLKNVIPEKYVLTEAPFFGVIKNTETNLCFDTLGIDELQVRHFSLAVWICVNPGESRHQLFSLSDLKELRREIKCVDATGETENILMFECHRMAGNQQWNYNQKTQQFIHAPTGKCIDVEGVQPGKAVNLRPCTDSVFQKWQLLPFTLD